MKKLVHGGDVYGAGTDIFGRGNRELLDFSANLNPLGMPESVKDALCRSADSWERYPDPLCRELSAAIAEAEGCAAEHIICGNGAADLIFRLALAKKPKRALVLAPTFAEYEQALGVSGCETERYLLSPENDFKLTEDFTDALTAELDMVFLCSPNNPTGQPADPELMAKIVARCREKEIFLVVDECFLDFAENGERYSVKPYLAEQKNIFLLRAFTKIYAMAGLRLGYGVCTDEELLSKLSHCGQPWSVSTPAQQAGITALAEPNWIPKTQRFVAVQRELLRAGLERLGVTVFPSEANYLLFYSGDSSLHHKLRERGILIRDCANYYGLGCGYYRIAVRTERENRLLLEAIAAVREDNV